MRKHPQDLSLHMMTHLHDHQLTLCQPLVNHSWLDHTGTHLVNRSRGASEIRSAHSKLLLDQSYHWLTLQLEVNMWAE